MRDERDSLKGLAYVIALAVGVLTIVVSLAGSTICDHLDRIATALESRMEVKP